ncbi:unnamed protein product, partial [Prorocentrum cordatum]
MEEGYEGMSEKEMMKTMMRMMKEMKNDMKNTGKEMKEAKDMALQAKYSASMAEEAVIKVKGEMYIIRDTTIKKADLPNMVKDIVKEQAHQPQETKTVDMQDSVRELQ